MKRNEVKWMNCAVSSERERLTIFTLNNLQVPVCAHTHWVRKSRHTSFYVVTLFSINWPSLSCGIPFADKWHQLVPKKSWPFRTLCNFQALVSWENWKYSDNITNKQPRIKGCCWLFKLLLFFVDVFSNDRSIIFWELSSWFGHRFLFWWETEPTILYFFVCFHNIYFFGGREEREHSDLIDFEFLESLEKVKLK